MRARVRVRGSEVAPIVSAESFSLTLFIIATE